MGQQRMLILNDNMTDRARPSLREPLTDSAGNINYPVLASNGNYNGSEEALQSLDKKVACTEQDDPCMNCKMGFGDNCLYQPHEQSMVYNSGSLRPYGWAETGYGVATERAPHSRFTLPSQRLGGIRRKAGGGRRSRNPIADSVHYQAYRQRQTRDGDVQKWPDELEDLFLDAIMAVPYMGRRKYSFKGKPHGRNELVSEYLWIGYCNSLPRGTPPDDKMKRGRKQVSSHIQVLKGFMKDTPEFHRLFPEKSSPANGFEDSFKDDKTLTALSKGQLPTHDDSDEELAEDPQPLFLKPFSFEMFVSTSENDFKESIRIHDYSTLSSPSLNGSRQSLDMVRDRFPELERLEATNSLPPVIIHLIVGINLMRERPDGAELNTRVFLQVNMHPQTEWQTSTTLTKPSCLSGARHIDPPIYQKIDVADYIPENDGTIRLHISFPALPWAHAFMQLIDVDDDALLETITMYQEINSKTANQPYIRRAILLWTFQHSPNSAGETTWRYVGPPERNQVFSPGIEESQPHHQSIHSVLDHGLNSGDWDDHSLSLPMHMSSDLMGHDPFTAQGFGNVEQEQAHESVPILRSPFEPGLLFAYEQGGVPQGGLQQHEHRQLQSHGLNHHDQHQHQQNLPSTPQHHSSHDQDVISKLGIQDSTLNNMPFDSNHGLDIQLAYDSVGFGIDGGGVVGVVGPDVVGFNGDALHGGRDPWLTPTPGGHHHFDQFDVGVDAGGEGWRYSGLGHGVGVGVGLGGCQWDAGVGVGGGELGGGGGQGGYDGSGHGNQDVAGNMLLSGMS